MECSFLEDEKFDFDLPLSPEEERNDEGDDDEIFFGPIGYNERCIATNTETNATKIHDDIEKTKPVSPLKPEQVVELFREATSVAVMLKSCSSEVNSDSEDRERKHDFPELITDITKKKPRVSRDNQVENVSETRGSEATTARTDVTESESDDSHEGFVVIRRRALSLRERNSVVNNNGTSKIQRLKTPTRPSNQKSVSRTAKKSSILTPKRISDAERNNSSSVINTSFGEESKQSKLPMASHGGLKAPGFSSGRRRRSSSNSSFSSTSSTSSIPGFNQHETFTVSKGSEQPKTSNTKQPSSQKSRPSARGMLTKAFTSKPVFAKPHEVSKTSKLQPIKAVQTAAGSSKRLSSAGLRSPAPKTNTRPASAGGTCTPLRTPTPKADRTPVKGQTPIRRRISNASSITMKTRQNGLVTSSEVSEKAVTRQARRSITGIPGVGGAKTNAVSGAMTRRPASAMKATFKSQFEKHRTPQPSTPEKKLEKAKNGPDKTAETPEHKSKPVHRRHSLLPTPNQNKTTKGKTRNFSLSKPSSSVSDSRSPEPFSITNKAKLFRKKLDLSPASPKNYTSCLSSGKCSSSAGNTTNKPRPASPEIKPNTPRAKIPETTTVLADDGPDLLLQGSPVLEASLVDVMDMVDSVSPGIDSPDFPIDGCLDPVVITMEVIDLIDLSYVSPSEEVDLIDLAAKSPLVEAKLVDI